MAPAPAGARDHVIMLSLQRSTEVEPVAHWHVAVPPVSQRIALVVIACKVSTRSEVQATACLSREANVSTCACCCVPQVVI